MASIKNLYRDLTLRRIFLFTALIKFGFLFFLPGTPSLLAPDEGAYAQLTEWFAIGKDFADPATPGIGLYESSRSLIIPAGLLCKLGIQGLIAVRLVSVTYGLLSILIFITLINSFSNNVTSSNLIKIKKLEIFVVGIYIFLPSHFLWSELGLRESASEFWILLSVYLLLRVANSPNSSKNYHFYGLLAMTLIFAIGSRKQTAMVFILAVFLSLFFARINKKTFLTLGTLLVAGTLGFLFVATPVVAVQKVYELEPLGETAVQTSPPATKSATTAPKPQKTSIKSASPSASQSTSASPSASQSTSASPSASLCFTSKQIIKIDNKKYICKLQTPKIATQIITEQLLTKVKSAKLSDLQYHYEVNRVDAESALPESKCGLIKSASIKLSICLVQELPYRMTNLLFRPLFPIDAGSLTYNLASLENYLWFTLILVTIIFMTQVLRSKNNLEFPFFICAYLVGFIVGSALYEGNLGTAFRHKSSILWCLLLVVFVFLKQNINSSNTIRKVSFEN